MATTPSELLDRAQGKDLGELLRQGFGGVLLALATASISGILSIADLVIKPADAFANALAQLTIAAFGSPARIIIAGANETVRSITGPFGVGPLTFALGIAAVLAGLWVIGQYRQETETGNLILGLPFDVPFIGQNEEGAD